MRLTTKKLLDRLTAARPGVYQVDEADVNEDSEVIGLHNSYVLVVDEDAALATVSLDELMKVGGNVQIADWVITSDAVLDQVVTVALNV
ncbi:hypothetical protein [Thiomonas sp.]